MDSNRSTREATAFRRVYQDSTRRSPASRCAHFSRRLSSTLGHFGIRGTQLAHRHEQSCSRTRSRQPS